MSQLRPHTAPTPALHSSPADEDGEDDEDDEDNEDDDDDDEEDELREVQSVHLNSPALAAPFWSSGTQVMCIRRLQPAQVGDFDDGLLLHLHAAIGHILAL